MAGFRVLVADKLSPRGVAVLEEASGFEVDVRVGMKPAELLEVVSAYDAVLVRSATRITPEVIERATRLKMVGRAGIGVDNIDIPAATRAGVVVMNTPTGNSVTTAEHAISLLMSLARHIPQATASMREGLWQKSRFKGTEIDGKTLGILGLGNIGRIVADRAQGLHMRVIAHDPTLTSQDARQLGVESVGLPELFQRADFLTIHAPLNHHTRGLVGADAFGLMKDGVRIINAARGGIVDEEALLVALQSGKVAGAALDVFSSEPPPEDFSLRAHPSVILTPHLGASTFEAQERVAVQIAEQARDYLASGEIRNALNAPALSPSLVDELAPYIELAGLLGVFIGQLLAEAPTHFEAELVNDQARKEQAPVVCAALAGLLDGKAGGQRDWLRAPHEASERGVEVQETYSRREDAFGATVRLTVRGETSSRSVTGTLFARKGPRIVAVDDLPLEAAPSTHMLLLGNADSPGVIGAVGSALGEAGVNVSRVQMGRRESEGAALSLWNLDTAASPAVMAGIQAIPHVHLARLVRL